MVQNVGEYLLSDYLVEFNTQLSISVLPNLSAPDGPHLQSQISSTKADSSNCLLVK